jgi:hypothetical protein
MRYRYLALCAVGQLIPRRTAGHHKLPEVIAGSEPGLRRPEDAAAECTPKMLVDPSDPDYVWTAVWEDLEEYQRLGFELLGWNITMWDDPMLMRPSPQIFRWPDPPTTTATPTTTTVAQGLLLSDSGSPNPAPGDNSQTEDNATTTASPSTAAGGGSRLLRGRPELELERDDLALNSVLEDGGTDQGEAEAYRMLQANATQNATGNGTGNGSASVIPGFAPTTTTTTTAKPGPRINELCYFSLTQDQQMAVHGLGYTINSWNCFQPCPLYDLQAGPADQFVSACEEILIELRTYHDRSFQYLTAAEKKALSVLKISKKNWDSTGIDFIADTKHTKWDMLSSEEKVAASSLGFTLSTWNMCQVDYTQEIDEHFPTTSPPPTPAPKNPLRPVQGKLTMLNHKFDEVSGMQSVFRKALQQAFAKALSMNQVQFQERRIMILDLREGREGTLQEDNTILKDEAIIVDFVIRQLPEEQQQGEMFAVAALDALGDLLEDPGSTLRQMKYLKGFLAETALVEVAMDETMLDKMAEYMEFELLRGYYNESNACQLKRDLKHGVDPCVKAGAASMSFAVLLAALLQW